jgi:hypothetical protein
MDVQDQVVVPVPAIVQMILQGTYDIMINIYIPRAEQKDLIRELVGMNEME